MFSAIATATLARSHARRSVFAAGAFALAATAGAAATANSEFVTAVETFSAMPRAGYPSGDFGASAPFSGEGLQTALGSINGPIAGPITVSAVAGRVVPPTAAKRVLHQFDQVIECADADLEIDHRMADLDDLSAKPSLVSLERFWRAHGLGEKAIALGAGVPPLFLDRIPQDLTSDLLVPRKKRAFVLMLLPHVLAANEEILAERARVENLRAHLDDPVGPTDQEIDWLFRTFAKYGVKGQNFETLLARVDVIPPALAIAQAAKETGWGGSRFARMGNALYGQWTWDPSHKGIVPKARPKGKTHRVRAFDSVLEATRAYALNINRQGAYGELREIRRDLRRAGKQPKGAELAAGLKHYSEIGGAYIKAVRNLMRRNRLTRLNEARLGDHLLPPPFPEMFDDVAKNFAASPDQS